MDMKFVAFAHPHLKAIYTALHRRIKRTVVPSERLLIRWFIQLTLT